MKKKPTYVIPFDDTSSAVVFGAHPDDAVRGCGGVMLRSLAAGGRLTVIAVTDGAALFGTKAVRDGRRTARARKAEQAKALEALGARERNTLYLGLPDGGIPKLRHKHRTEHSGAYFCPWLDSDSTNDTSYVPGMDFTGKDLTHILTHLLAAAKPTHVFTHHSRDRHPDHRGVTWFMRKALAELFENSTSTRKGGGSGDPPPHSRGRRVSRPAAGLLGEPAIYEYLTYLSGTPWPPAGPAVPVKAAKALPFSGRVVNFRLTPAEQKRKNAALDCFVPILGDDYIDNWRRTNEIYWRS